MRRALAASPRRTDAALLLSCQRGSASRARAAPPWLRGGRAAREKSSLNALSDARGGIMSELLLDAAGRRRSPATLPHFHARGPPRNKGIRYPADPPTVEEIIDVMRAAGDGVHGRRSRGLIVVLWRAGLRIHEALALSEADLDPRRGSLLVRRGKGGRRREVGMDDWGVGGARAVAQGARRTAHRTAVLRDQRSDPWTAMVCVGGALGPAACGAPGRRAAAVRAAPAPACPCR
jgi:integrase